MKDYTETVEETMPIIINDLERMNGDDKLNYLYTLRDEINKLVKQNRK